MANNSMTIVLPNREEMLRRLRGVSDGLNVDQRLYPLLLEYAGTEVYPSSVVDMVFEAMQAYTQRLKGVAVAVFVLRIPDYIRALLADNPQALREALEYNQSLAVE